MHRHEREDEMKIQQRKKTLTNKISELASTNQNHLFAPNSTCNFLPELRDISVEIFGHLNPEVCSIINIFEGNVHERSLGFSKRVPEINRWCAVVGIWRKGEISRKEGAPFISLFRVQQQCLIRKCDKLIVGVDLASVKVVRLVFHRSHIKGRGFLTLQHHQSFALDPSWVGRHRRRCGLRLLSSPR